MTWYPSPIALHNHLFYKYPIDDMMKKARLIMIFNKDINRRYDEKNKINFDIILSNVRILISKLSMKQRMSK